MNTNETFLARDKHGAVLKSNFSTDKSARTRTLERDRSPADRLEPRRWTPAADQQGAETSHQEKQP